jgi:hypothetical protein
LHWKKTDISMKHHIRQAKLLYYYSMVPLKYVYW